MSHPPANRRLGILLSGRGSNFEAIADRIDAGKLNAEIAVVISNIETAPGFQRAQTRNLPAIHIPSRKRLREEFDGEVVAVLRKHDVSLVVLAGFMRIFSPVFTQAFPQRILNIHPSLLPAFPGLEPQRQTLESGVRFSGCTVHIVDDVLDGGPIVMQAVVPVLDDDTVESLAARILVEEHRIYSDAIDLVLAGKYEIQGRRIIRR